ncbi:MAG: hypothetical protein AAGI38_20680 [Bacteroidota bacterium]
MEGRTVYMLEVKKRKELLTQIVDLSPENASISFEGELKGVLVPKYLISADAIGLHKRNTLAPRMDFWVFNLEKKTKEYLKADFINRIGIASNVIHVLMTHQESYLFASYYHFASGMVQLFQSDFFSKETVLQLVKAGIVAGFEEVILPAS